MAMSRAMVELTETSSSSIHIAVSSSFLPLLLMLLLILLVIFFACRPWRFFARFLSSSSSRRPIKAEDLERLLVSDDSVHNTEFARTCNVEGASHQIEGHFNSSRNQGLAYKHRFPHTATKLAHTHSDSLILDISEDTSVGQTLKRPSVTNLSGDIQKVKEDSCHGSGFGLEDKANEFLTEYSAVQKSTKKSGLPLTLGRVPPSALLLKDSEVSGKHAMIKWNSNKLKWELVDMGSLNGTLLNSQAISHANSGSRHWGDPIELASGDTITLGSISKIAVQIISQTEKVAFGVGVASDPMSLRRGGKKLPMEDVCYYQWPLHGIDQFGLFGICDGHGGAAAAVSASKLLQKIVADILADSVRRERVLTKCDASDVLQEAFTQTEACMNHYYEGCTATMLMVWTEDHENFYAQCANVGDSACFVKIIQRQPQKYCPVVKVQWKHVGEKHIKMTEDHRIISGSERERIQATGEPLKEGETRLCGLNLGRMLGDKFLKHQEARFSSEPYISQVVYIHQASRAFVVLASDGFWDVVNFKKAFQLAQETRDRSATDGENTAEKIANILLGEARTQRTKDNTSIIFLEFDSNNRDNHSKL